MEADDLDNLIAESLTGVQSALEADRKQAAVPEATSSTAGEAVATLQQGLARSDGKVEPVPNEEFFTNLVKSFQDDNFQKAMAEALQISDVEKDSVVTGAPGGSLPSEPSVDDSKVEDFVSNFMKSFDKAMEGGGGDAFSKQMNQLMTSMLSPQYLTEPLQQIVSAFEPWMRAQKGLSASDRSKYEAQIKLYKEIIAIYKRSPDPLPDDVQKEVQEKLTELNSYGPPPDEVMRQIAPKEAEEGDDSFEDFMKSLGLDENLGSAEQDLLKKLTEDPEELTKVMQDMAGKLGDGAPDEACKQQ
jgi:hypothetical protein